MKKIIVLLILIKLSSCAFAPMSSSYSARTNGKGEMNLDIGSNAGFQVPYFRLGYGIFERMDFGLLMETSALVTAVGLWTKIGLIQSDNGFSWSLLGSIGDAGAGDYYYAGTIVSLKLKRFEIYGLARYNYVKTEAGDIEINDLFTIPVSYELNYYQYTLGMNLWFADWFGFNLNATTFTGDIESLDTALFGGAVLFKF